MTKRFYSSDLNRERCGLCNLYSGNRRVNRGFLTNTSVEVESPGFCTHDKKEISADTRGCRHFELCGHAESILSEIRLQKEKEQLRRENERAARELKEQQDRMERERWQMQIEQERAEERARYAAMSPSEKRAYNAQKQREQAAYERQMKKQAEEYEKRRKIELEKRKKKFKIKKIVFLSLISLGIILAAIGITCLLTIEFGNNFELAEGLIFMTATGMFLSLISATIFFISWYRTKKY